jgi:hypothetical protein
MAFFVKITDWWNFRAEDLNPWQIVARFAFRLEGYAPTGKENGREDMNIGEETPA